MVCLARSAATGGREGAGSGTKRAAQYTAPAEPDPFSARIADFALAAARQARRPETYDRHAVRPGARIASTLRPRRRRNPSLQTTDP